MHLRPGPPQRAPPRTWNSLGASLPSCALAARVFISDEMAPRPLRSADGMIGVIKPLGVATATEMSAWWYLRTKPTSGRGRREREREQTSGCAVWGGAGWGGVGCKRRGVGGRLQAEMGEDRLFPHCDPASQASRASRASRALLHPAHFRLFLLPCPWSSWPTACAVPPNDVALPGAVHLGHLQQRLGRRLDQKVVHGQLVLAVRSRVQALAYSAKQIETRGRVRGEAPGGAL